MGDIADMVLEGLLDEVTGEYIGDINRQQFGMEAPGFPVSYSRNRPKDLSTQVVCPVCGKSLDQLGIYHHAAKRHPELYDQLENAVMSILEENT